MLQFESGSDPLKVLAGAFWRPNIHKGTTPQDSAHAIQAVHEICHAGRFKGHRAVTAIGSEEVYVRNIRIENLRAERLYSNVMDKARTVFDFDVNLAKIFVLGATPLLQEDRDIKEVVLLGIPKRVITKRRELLDEMDIELAGLDPEPISIFRAFKRFLRRNSDRHTTNTMVNVGPDSTLVIVSRGAEICFLKRIDIGTRKLTKAVGDYLGLDFEDASRLRSYLMEENIKHSQKLGLVNPVQGCESPSSSLLWSVYDSVRSQINALVLEIGLCLRYCSTTFGCPKMDKVTLTGAGAWDPSLIYMLHENLGLRSEVARPMQNIDVSQCPIFSDRRSVLSDWTGCVGLALHDKDSDDYELKDVHGSNAVSVGGVV
ncbi:MAG: pilus assembly protein PilM [Phycisphaerae bacterium]|nr:pilus assembly protein PilM [Phycisphaerae bacterium]